MVSELQLGWHGQYYIDPYRTDTANSPAFQPPRPGLFMINSAACLQSANWIGNTTPICGARTEQACTPMTEDQDTTDYSRIDARLSPSSKRRRSPLRRMYFAVGMPILQLVLNLLFRSYRIQPIIGAHTADKIIEEKTVCAPCYWHQDLLLGNLLLRKLIGQGLHAGFLISASVDGDVPERIAASWGAEVIRGSANTTGALALRDMRRLFQKGISVVSVGDGPTGPKSVLKSGVVLMARIANVPLLPIACAADKAWFLNRWDDFMIPKPFSRVVLAIGMPIAIPANAPLDALERYRVAIERALNALGEESRRALRTARR
jgi:lysophospholipid acyltransferase (LPLAT)-like uncharacterized protein